MGSHTNMVSRKNAMVINFCEVASRVEFRLVFRASVEFRSVLRALSRKFKILAIHDVLADGKTYEHGFTKKRDGHKLCVESSFDRFFVHHLENSKY
ncbi:hypothetical protein B296_00023903 [Ensete ventricosum]|uniref:Uncharacterized protein n=1 Tax=Ensete ventricosum TaxID=4639 RepID=A0A426X6X5_ENSVE|nr:hypothetical protein B296_00023903 [Ensete ventricosum]